MGNMSITLDNSLLICFLSTSLIISTLRKKWQSFNPLPPYRPCKNDSIIHNLSRTSPYVIEPPCPLKQ